jgi:hypothetical protein
MSQTEPTVALPFEVYKELRDAFARDSAQWLARSWRDPSARQALHTGDQFGRVFAWIWNHDPSEAMSFLADVLIELRDREPGISINPRVRLDEILEGLWLALPSGFRGYDEAADRARHEVPRYYGGDPNGP